MSMCAAGLLRQETAHLRELLDKLISLAAFVTSVSPWIHSFFFTKKHYDRLKKLKKHYSYDRLKKHYGFSIKTQRKPLANLIASSVS